MSGYLKRWLVEQVDGHHDECTPTPEEGKCESPHLLTLLQLCDIFALVERANALTALLRVEAGSLAPEHAQEHEWRQVDETEDQRCHHKVQHLPVLVDRDAQDSVHVEFERVQD